MPAVNPDGHPAFINVGMAYSHNPLGVATLFASLSLSIPDGKKIPIYWRNEKIEFSEPIDLPLGVEEPNPFWVGYIFSNQRYSHMTKVYYLYQPCWEYNDDRGEIRFASVFSDSLYKNYRKFTNSSIIGTEEAIGIIADCFMHWYYTKDIINKIFAQRFDPNTGSNSSMVLK